MTSIFKPDFKWRLYSRGRTSSMAKGKIIDIYQKGEPKNEKYPISWHNWFGTGECRVHVYNRSGDIWKSFKTKNDAEEFVKECKEKIFWMGELFNNRSEACVKYPFTLKPFGNEMIPQKTKDKVIAFVVDGKNSTITAGKKFKKLPATIWYILDSAGCKFIPDKSRGGNKGEWRRG